MRTCLRNLAIVLATGSAISMAGRASAQVIIGRGGGGISVGIPGLGGVRVGAPLRRGIVVAPLGTPYGYAYGTPYPYGPVPRYSARPIIANAATVGGTLPTVGELRVMTDSELLNATSQLAAQLQEDLNRFDTADTWQRYLNLPEEALPPATTDGRVILGRQALVDTLARFDRTVANGRYVQISSLPSYAAMHAALAELVQRFGNASEMTAAPSSAASPVVPPALPQPPRSAVITRESSSPANNEPQSIEMRNLHASPAAVESRAARPAPSTSGRSEELPSPPPALVAPGNDSSEEHSVLAR